MNLMKLVNNLPWQVHAQMMHFQGLKPNISARNWIQLTKDLIITTKIMRKLEKN